jgi:MSHA pilin protein MshD
MKYRGMYGFTLIEMIVIIVVIAIVAVAMLGVFTNVRSSADPMLQMQATALAQGYLEEALLKAFTDPDQVETGTCEALETRATYDDVQDYNCVNDNTNGTGPLDQFGNPLGALGAYNVNVNVTADTIGVVATQRVDVIVTHDSHPLTITLTAHRANY